MIRAPHPIDAPGTEESAWAAWPGLDALPDAGLAGVDSAVIVAAHPDDEVLGAGGLIATLAASGARLRLVAVTDGEGSHRGRADRTTLGARRTAETAAALRALGAETTDVVRLGLPDSGLAGREDELTAALGQLIAGFGLCLAPWDGDMHPDHETAGRAARRAARPARRPGARGARGAPGAWFLCYPIWMWHWASPGDRTAHVARRGGAAVVTIGARSVGAARAAGARAVLRRTRHLDPADVWMATTDADTLVPACWLRQQVRHADRGWDAVAGTVQVADWSGYRPAVRAAFRERYAAGLGPRPPVHGANLGFRAAAYLKAGGFPDAPTAEDHALVAALTLAGGRVLRTPAVSVVTSARRVARAPRGFSHYLAKLDAATA